jgi:hypothetical protein
VWQRAHDQSPWFKRRKFNERREGGKAGAEREEHPFLAGLWPAAIQDLPQDKQNGR